MSNRKLSATALMKELDLSRYINLSKKENKGISDSCRGVFVSQIESTYNRTEQVSKALRFFETIWKKYDCGQVSTVYQKFVKIEEALYGLEREEELGERYRDHSTHMFNCFAFGLRIISSMLEQLPSDNKRKRLFKVEDENFKDLGLPFSDYSYSERLFYLWTLISTFHDIAIPFQHMTKLGKGISRFTEEFGWAFTDPEVSMHNFDSSQLLRYFTLITSLYDGELKLYDKRRKYARPNDHHYLTKLLGREFDLKNHGVMSGFFTWKMIEEIFLVERDSKHPLDMKQFNTYTEYILEQDIARVALAISLHGLGEDEKSQAYPKVFPIDFHGFPLAFLIVLSDELQEYLRWEGSALKKDMVFNYHPNLDIQLNKANHTVTMIVSFSLDSNMEKKIIDNARRLMTHLNTPVSTLDFTTAVDIIGNSIQKALERKLLLGAKFKLKLEIFKDWKTQLYGKDLISTN